MTAAVAGLGDADADADADGSDVIGLEFVSSPAPITGTVTLTLPDGCAPDTGPLLFECPPYGSGAGANQSLCDPISGACYIQWAADYAACITAYIACIQATPTVLGEQICGDDKSACWASLVPYSQDCYEIESQELNDCGGRGWSVITDLSQPEFEEGFCCPCYTF